jgi:hypothetical protein
VNSKNTIGDLDLQLFLAGAMPLYQRLLLTLALLVSGELRNRLRAVKKSNQVYRQEVMAGLESRLFPGPSRIFKVAHGRPANWGLAWVGSLALLTLCALPFLHQQDAVIGKGPGLGVNVFVKGDSAYRVENQAAHILLTDTLQVVPIGSEMQHLLLLGWDENQGIARLYPQDGNQARAVSPREPPPALLLQGVGGSRLICISATKSFKVNEALEMLKRLTYPSPGQAPVTHLEDGMYIQIFNFAKKTGRI